MSGDPNVLVISDEGPQSGTAGGLLLQRLFARYPSGKLRVLSRYCPTLGDPLPGVEYRLLRVPWQRFEKSRFNVLKRSLRAFGAVPSVGPGEILPLLEGFRPDVVFTVMQHAVYYDAAHRFARLAGLPLVVAVHDVNEEFEPVYPWALAAARKRDGAFYRYASRRLCVSPEMERLCAERYGAAGSVLYPNRSEDLEARDLRDCAELRRPGGLTLGFAGNLGYGYGLGILQMIEALRRSGSRLVIYGRAPQGDAAPLAQAGDCCELRGFVPSSEAWAGIKRDCDAVWLPYPETGGKMRRLYSYHFPSKLPEYLALGMPVVVSGPDYATGVRWTLNNLGPDATAGNPGQLEAILRRLASEAGFREASARRALDAGRRDFDPARIAADFRGHLAAAAGPVGP